MDIVPVNRYFIQCVYCLTDSQPFRSRANSLPGAKVPIGPWPIRFLELSLPGPFVHGNIRSRTFSLPGTFTPGSFRSPELSFPGTFAPQSELALEAKSYYTAFIIIGVLTRNAYKWQ